MRRLSRLAALALAAGLACKKHAPAPTPVGSAVPTASTSAAAAASTTPPIASAPASASWGPLVPSRAHATQYCAVFGSFPLDQRSAAEALRAKIAAKVPTVELHDASDFLELAWGELVVVAPAADRATAGARVTDAKGTQAGYVKACSPLTGSLATGTAAPSVDRGSTGCLGWNPTLGRALCITGSFQVHTGYDLVAREVGGDDSFGWRKSVDTQSWFDTDIEPDAIANVRALATKDHDVTLAGHRARALSPGAELAWASPKITFAYRRWQETSSTSERMTHDSIRIACRGSERELFAFEGLNLADEAGGSRMAADGGTEPASPSVELHYAPAEQRVLAVWRPSYAYEGTFGDETFAEWIDLAHEECKPE